MNTLDQAESDYQDAITHIQTPDYLFKPEIRATHCFLCGHAFGVNEKQMHGCCLPCWNREHT